MLDSGYGISESLELSVPIGTATRAHSTRYVGMIQSVQIPSLAPSIAGHGGQGPQGRSQDGELSQSAHGCAVCETPP